MTDRILVTSHFPVKSRLESTTLNVLFVDERPLINIQNIVRFISQLDLWKRGQCQLRLSSKEVTL